MRAPESTSVLTQGREFHQFFATAALAVSVLAIWALTHEYKGLVYDGQIYAVQALAKLRPSLHADLFLQNTTQDRFTIFPRIYAWLIACMGLNPAALLLTSLFSLWFLSAAWNFTAHLFSRDYAWLAVFLLVITGGHYGAFGVFRFLEPFLTARLAAEALVITGLALHFRGFRRVPLGLAIAALVVHPLLALPGLLLLICLQVPWRVSSAAAVIGALGCLSIAAASTLPAVGRLLPLMDPAWAEVVRERSQFLFLQLWTLRDWELNARPFVCLTLTAMALRDDAIRKLALCAMLVGATGLLIAAIASWTELALLMQGQAWRWMWITTFVSVVLLVPTARFLWNQDWGRACAVLLVAGWSFAADIGFVYASLALLIWIMRDRWPHSDRLERWATAAIIVSIIAWAAVDTWTAIAPLSARSNAHPLLINTVSTARAIFGLRIWCVFLACLAWYGIGKISSRTLLIAISCALGTAAACLLYEPFARSSSFGSVSDMNEFADWRRAIPPVSTVFVTNGHDSGSFVWFTLERNNYLSAGQSAGVVFSRATALEVRRRSQVLLPLVDPNWKMLTSLRSAAAHAPGGARFNHYPLTAKSLIGVCSDPVLDFVISPDDVGFEPIRHAHPDAYENWNLYDCNRVRAQVPVR